MKIGFIGHGNVGGALISSLSAIGHDILVGTRSQSEDNINKIAALGSNVRSVPLSNLSDGLSVVFLAVPFAAAVDALKTIQDCAGLVVVDCTNPVGANVSHGLNSEISGTELLQNKFPKLKLVKSFTVYGFENFQNSRYPGYGELKPVMPIAGDDAKAKNLVAQLATELAWQPLDVGEASTALHLEHMTLLWIKLARVQGKGSDFTWAMLTR